MATATGVIAPLPPDAFRYATRPNVAVCAPSVRLREEAAVREKFTIR